MFFTISAVLAWNLIVIVLFVINSTFTLVYQGLGASASSGVGLASMFFEIFMYIVYLVAVFVLFRFALGIMKDGPDMLKEKLNLKKGNDSSYIDSLAFEQYVNARIMSDIATLPTNLAKGLAAYREGGAMTGKEAKEAADRSEEFSGIIDEMGGPEAFFKKMRAVKMDESEEGSAMSDAMAHNASNATNSSGDGSSSEDTSSGVKRSEEDRKSSDTRSSQTGDLETPQSENPDPAASKKKKPTLEEKKDDDK
jgi:hypothetical protein